MPTHSGPFCFIELLNRRPKSDRNANCSSGVSLPVLFAGGGKPAVEFRDSRPARPDGRAHALRAAAVEPEPAAEPEQPKYTKDDVQALVRKLAAPNSPEHKRAGAKAIVKTYGAKVSDIPEDKYSEAMDKLTALDKEG